MAQHFTELITYYAEGRKDRKAKVTKAKKEADEAKSKISTFQADYDEKMKSAEKTNCILKKQVQTFQTQMANLQNSVKQDNKLKENAVKKAKEEEKKISEDNISELKSDHDDDLANDELQGWNDASSAAAEEIPKIKDMLYKAGYEFGLESARVLGGDELFETTMLCPPDLFATQSQRPNEVQQDEEEVAEHQNVEGTHAENGQTFCNKWATKPYSM